MPAWGEILREISEARTANPQAPVADNIRRKYLVQLSTHTGRPTILYATRWTNPGPATPDVLSITEEDVQGLMEVVYGLSGSSLDLILHTPGGSIVAAEAFTRYLRSKFKDIRVIIPHAAMSAGTLISCAATKVLMARHSFLGPIDPQLLIQTELGFRAVPAQAILDQFEKARQDCTDPKNLGSWLPILKQYGPSLLIECENAVQLSKILAEEWLKNYMFAGDPNAATKASEIAGKLGDHGIFKNHGRHIDRESARSMGLKLENLEDDQTLQDLVLSVFHCVNHTFNLHPAGKIIENHHGRAFVRLVGAMVQPQNPA